MDQLKDRGITHWSEALAVAMEVELGLAQAAAEQVAQGNLDRLLIADIHRLAKWTLYWKNPEPMCSRSPQDAV